MKRLSISLVAVGLALSATMAGEVELEPMLTQPHALVLEGDFSKPQPTLDKQVWKSRQHTRWSFEEGVLRGRPSTKEFQASQNHHQGFEPRLSVPSTPQNFALRLSFRFLGGEANRITPFIEFGHHVVRVHLGAAGARLLVAGESLLVGEAKDFKPKDGEWIDALVEVQGDEFVIQFADGPTLYAKHAGIAAEKDGFGIAGTRGGTVEIRKLSIWSVKSDSAQGWGTRREALGNFVPVPIIKPAKKKPAAKS